MSTWSVTCAASPASPTWSLSPRTPGEAVSAEIADSLVRNAAIDADRIKVTDTGGAVTLSGTVRSYAERREAERAAWLAPGVVSVDDQLVISA